jgi:hypothetical protein
MYLRLGLPPSMLGSSEEETLEMFTNGDRKYLFSKNGQTPRTWLSVADDGLYILRNLSKCKYVRGDTLGGQNGDLGKKTKRYLRYPYS